MYPIDVTQKNHGEDWKRIRLKREKSEQKRSKPDKNEKRVEAEKNLKQLQATVLLLARVPAKIPYNTTPPPATCLQLPNTPILTHYPLPTDTHVAIPRYSIGHKKRPTNFEGSDLIQENDKELKGEDQGAEPLTQLEQETPRGKRKTRKRQNQNKTGQKREAWKSPAMSKVKGKQEKDKIGTKPDKNKKRRNARQCQRPIPVKKAKKEENTKLRGQKCKSYKLYYLKKKGRAEVVNHSK
nr:hypothetical protein [Tanacetum cinerariifolium]